MKHNETGNETSILLEDMKHEIKDVNLSDCWVEIDPTKDYRKPLAHYKVNDHGDL